MAFDARGSTTAIDDYAMLAVQGPLAREIVQAISDAPLPDAHDAPRPARLAGAEVLVCGTGYTGEDGVELLLAPEDAPRCGTSSCAAAPRRPGSARATRCAWRPAFTSTATSSSLERGPIEAGLGWCCKEDTGFIGARGACGRGTRRRRGPARASSSRSRSTAPASRARATRSSAAARSRAARSRPVWRSGIGMAYVPAERAAVGTPPGDRRRVASDASATCRAEASEAALPSIAFAQLNAEMRARDGRGQLSGGPAVPPRARLGARSSDEPEPATLGITWYAQDALGEVVFFEPPAVGATARQGRALRRGRVGEGRLRRGRARCPGEIVEVNEALADNPQPINEDPYGEGWLVKVRLADPSERDALMDAARLYAPSLGG